MIAIGTDHYVVMTDPLSFIDVLSFGSPASERGVDQHQNAPDHCGQFNAGSAGTDANHPGRAKENASRWIGLCHSARCGYGAGDCHRASLAPLAQNWHRLLVIWLPFGLLMSMLIALLLLRILRRLQSPKYQLQDAIRSREISMVYQPIVARAAGESSAQKPWRAGDNRTEICSRRISLFRWRSVAV